MFDEGTKIAVCCIVFAGWVATMASDQWGPRPDLTTQVNAAALPPVPVTALASGAPAQTQVAAIHVALGDGFKARLLHGYALEGRVVTRREYRHDATSTISPLDLGIVWGALSAPGGIDDIAFSTAHRAIWSVPSPDADLPANWLDQVTNNHLVPANQAISTALLAVEVDAHIRIRGYLVEVTGDEIAPWRSSTRRGDSTIAGGCEIILVTDFELLSTVAQVVGRT